MLALVRPGALRVGRRELPFLAAFGVLGVALLLALTGLTLVVELWRGSALDGLGIAAMIEPVVASLVAYAWLGESLSAVQLVGGRDRDRRDPPRPDAR